MDPNEKDNTKKVESAGLGELKEDTKSPDQKNSEDRKKLKSNNANEEA